VPTETRKIAMVNEKFRFLSKDALSEPVQLDAAFSPIFAFSREVDDTAASIFFLERAVPKDDCELLSRLLVGRLLQDFESAVLLADRGLRAQSRAMARSTFETAVHLVSMCRKSALEVKKGEGKVTLDQLILSGHQRYRKNMASELSLIDETPEELKNSLRELNAQLNGEPNLRITFEEIAKQLDLWPMYTVLYRSLSQDSHISVISLEHHLVVNGVFQASCRLKVNFYAASFSS